ncbi:hypothetical protein BCV70DRAFT_18395 [Testicularia cyperi]|uniref:Integral membrane protein n=1 Tax=Testicularia cyperi TaxID=1882483 RepID=A0A317Y1K2_9BASI|nr:hypothetical protein BCV70DRAFT_18395 [Testicularia cyperi]
MKEAFSMPLQGWDPIRIISQLVAFQAIHYLILATLLPPLLAIFADTSSLMFEGGPTQIGMVFDWRQIAAKPTYDWTQPTSGKLSKIRIPGVNPEIVEAWNLDSVWLDSHEIVDHQQIIRFKAAQNGTLVQEPTEESHQPNKPTDPHDRQDAIEHWEWDHEKDIARSYVVIITWLLTIPPDIFLLVYLVRRPTHMLDHTLSFHLFNFLFTSFYAASPPISLAWYFTMLIHAAAAIVWSEQLAIKREMNRDVGYNLVGPGAPKHASNALIPPTTPRSKRTHSVLFDADKLPQESIPLREL